MRLKFSNDARDLGKEAIEGLDNRATVGWRAVLKRYVEEDLGFQVTNYLLWDRATVPRKPAELRSTLKRSFEVAGKAQSADSPRNPRNRRRAKEPLMPNVEDGQVKVAVLVNVPHFIKDCERMKDRLMIGYVWLPLLVHERLQSLKLFAKARLNSPKLV